MGYKEDQEFLRRYKLEHPEEYAAKVAEVRERLKQGKILRETEGYFIACRTWGLIITEDGLRLGSANNTIWPVYQELEAICSIRKDQHIAPDYKCQCGIYAVKLGRNPPSTGPIAGRLKMWGKYEDASEGYRTQYAYPEKFESFVCCACGKYFEEWSEAFGFVSYEGISYYRSHDNPNMRLLCYKCHDRRVRSKYTNTFFNGLEILDELNEAYGLIINPFKTFIEGIEGLGEGNDDEHR